jgi:hypothetical protein
MQASPIYRLIDTRVSLQTKPDIKKDKRTGGRTHKTVSGHHSPRNRVQRPQFSVLQRRPQILHRCRKHQRGHQHTHTWAYIRKEDVGHHVDKKHSLAYIGSKQAILCQCQMSPSFLLRLLFRVFIILSSDFASLLGQTRLKAENLHVTNRPT